MSSIPVQIVFQGLVALVPHLGADAHHATALLVDAQPPSGAQCVAEHTPRIRFVTSEPECTVPDECDVDREDDGGNCVCTLDRQEISIVPDAAPTPPVVDSAPSRSLPFDDQAAASFAYVGNLVRLGYPLDSAFLGNAPPPRLVARLRFPVAVFTACNLATRHDDLTDYVHPLSFRPLRDQEQSGQAEQALAQRVVASYVVDVDEASGQSLKLVLSPLPGATGQTHEFKLAGGATGVDIVLSNEREHFHNFDDPCDDGIGRDFAFFYDLAANPPLWAERPVPHVEYRVSKSVNDITPAVCKRFKAPMSRPICPMGSFFPS